MGLFDSFLDKGKNLGDLHRYVGDFKIVEIQDEKGRVRKRALYTGTWTVIRRFSPAVKARLWMALGAAVLLAVIYGRMLLTMHAASGQLLVMLPLLIGLFPGLYLLMGCASLPFRGKPMRRDQYMHSFIRASRSAVAVGAFVLVGLLASFIFRAIQGDWLFLSGDWGFLFSCILILALAAAILTLLRGVDLTERENAAYPGKPL